MKNVNEAKVNVALVQMSCTPEKGPNVAKAVSRIADAAKAGDGDAVATQVKAVGDACAACHRTYRAR